MKCLVTGGAGFIGSHLCERLISEGHTVTAYDSLVGGRSSNLDEIRNRPNFNFIVDDICNIANYPFGEVDWVFHLAALADIVPSIEAPTLYHNTNVTGTVHVLEAARKLKAKRFIYAASSSCYGIPDNYPTHESADCRPMYPYALTKYLGEQYVLHWAKVYGLSAISLRLFNVYGPRSRTNGSYGAVFGVFLSQLANNKPITVVGDGGQTRDFTYVSDVVEAFVMAAKSYCINVCMNVGSGDHYSINKLTDLLGAYKHLRVHIPERPGEPRTTFACIATIRAMLGWRALVSFKDGVAKMKSLIPQYKEAPLWTPEEIEKATEPWFRYLKGDGSAGIS